MSVKMQMFVTARVDLQVSEDRTVSIFRAEADFVLRFCASFRTRDMNMYLNLTAFTIKINCVLSRNLRENVGLSCVM